MKTKLYKQKVFCQHCGAEIIGLLVFKHGYFYCSQDCADKYFGEILQAKNEKE
jgi:hypothetical protein